MTPMSPPRLLVLVVRVCGCVCEGRAAEVHGWARISCDVQGECSQQDAVRPVLRVHASSVGNLSGGGELVFPPKEEPSLEQEPHVLICVLCPMSDTDESQHHGHDEDTTYLKVL